MAQISVNNMTFCYEGSYDNIFENVSFSIDTDWKLGFIGRNGKGKTTFLRLLMGCCTYSGEINTSVKFEYFPYQLADDQLCLPAAQFIEDIKPGCEIWQVICELSQLGEDAEILYRPFSTLSFGERTKILLAVLFSGENDFLLIDEPTNHLDQASRECVKHYLSSKKSFILVSHDRDLLDCCIDHVLVLNKKSIEVQSGNFSSWWVNKQRNDKFALSEEEKHRKEIRKLRRAARQSADWADKSERSKIGFDPSKEPDRSPGARAYIGTKTKKMQSRTKQLEKRIARAIEEKEGLLQDLEETKDLKLSPLTHYKNTLVNIADFGVRYKEAPSPVFEGLTFSIHRGDRVALHGSNGCGKSTLILSILHRVGLIDKTSFEESGLCETASGLIVSYVNQDTSCVRGSLLDFCKEHGLNKNIFYSLLNQLGLEAVQYTKAMENYSEGQKKKLLLAASLLTPAHLYIWDEPLNHIDVFSRMQIEKLLLEYTPTMLFVEHDVRFRQQIATKEIKM